MKIVTFDFEEHGDERGILISLEENHNIPFDIRRCYFMYNTQPGVSRGFHAHKTLQQVLICVKAEQGPLHRLGHLAGHAGLLGGRGADGAGGSAV